MTRYCKVYDKQGQPHLTEFADSFTQQQVERWAEREFAAAHS